MYIACHLPLTHLLGITVQFNKFYSILFYSYFGVGTNFCGIDDVKHFANYRQSRDSTRVILYIINLKHVTDQKNVKI